MKTSLINKGVVLCIIMLVTYCVNVAAQNFTANGINYSINDDNETVTVETVTVKRNEDVKGSLNIPAIVTYNNKTYSVTKIGYNAFSDCSGLTELTIPNSVTEIGVSAFSGCSGLTSITVANDNPKYDSRNNCNAIIETETNTLVAGCKNTIIPNSVIAIGRCVFWGCSGLTELTIPNSVTVIGDCAFLRCNGLTELTIPNSVTEIGSYAFSDCSGLTELTIPNSVTEIGSYAFSDCSGLTQVNIPNSVTKIGDGALIFCSALTQVTIPNSVTTIGENAFVGCCNLTSITVASDNPNYDSRNNCNAIIKTENNTLIAGCKNTVIPNSVTEIGDDAFRACSGLTQITIPNSVTEIGEWAFSDCTGLTKVTIPNSVTEIGEGAFVNCTGLTHVTVPKWLADNKDEMKRVFLGYDGIVKVNSSGNTKNKRPNRRSRRR